MTYRDDLKSEPWRFDLFSVLREFERANKDKPRIGDSAVLSEEIVNIMQDPFLEFPASNISKYVEKKDKPPEVYTKFLGYLGPQGALPLDKTIEAFHWNSRHDPSFSRFLDIFGTRFRQLFFRAWADARPVAQFGRRKEDRFYTYIGSIAGIGTNSFFDRDSIDDIAKLGFAGLVGSHIKSGPKLMQLIRGIFNVDVEVEERIGSWLTFEQSDMSSLGSSGYALGENVFVGSHVYSINEKIRISIKAKDLEQYRKFLPSGEISDNLTDLIFFYIGHRYEFDVQLSLPARYAPAAQLGVSGELGWTSWIAPDKDAPEDVYLSNARFNPMEQREKSKQVEMA